MNWDKMTAEPKSADGVAAANPIGLTNKYDSFTWAGSVNNHVNHKGISG